MDQQRLAMELFPQELVKDQQDYCERLGAKAFPEETLVALKNFVASSVTVPIVNRRGAVLDEILIFLVVHDLYGRYSTRQYIH
jgi:hypothetical protein